MEICDGQALPADCLLLKTTRDNGQVYVETAALDGERNLKPLLASLDIQENFTTLFSSNDSSRKPIGDEPVSQKIEFKMTEPLKDLYTFEGQAKIRNEKGGPIETINFDIA